MPQPTAYMATGRRKEAVARVRMINGNGQQTVNGRSIREYLGRDSLVRTVLQPLEVAQTAATFDIVANVHGGGVTGQAGAIRLGIARALLRYDEELRRPLRRAPFSSGRSLPRSKLRNSAHPRCPISRRLRSRMHWGRFASPTCQRAITKWSFVVWGTRRSRPASCFRGRTSTAESFWIAS